MVKEIAIAYMQRNSLARDELPILIKETFAILNEISKNRLNEAVVRVKISSQPAVPIAESISDNYITCLEDGRKFKTLKHHLSASHDMSPQDYIEKWGLPKDYPMIAPAYSEIRAIWAKRIGLGTKKN